MTATTETDEGISDDDALILAALDEAAEARSYRAHSHCSECSSQEDGPCAHQLEHQDAAERYRERLGRLEAGRG